MSTKTGQERVMAEMLNDACYFYNGGFCEAKKAPCEQECGCGCMAQDLYSKGYRKVDGTNYVSTEWHEEQLQHAQDEIENLKLQLQHAQENEEVLTKNAEEIAKQAVRDAEETIPEQFNIKRKEIEQTVARDILITIIDESEVDLLLGRYRFSYATIRKIMRKYGVERLDDEQ